MYNAELIDTIETKPGCWKSSKVGIFQGQKQVGEYLRNYDGMAVGTFCPFEQNGKWYALYSSDYTCTRLMSLPDCKNIGGEQPNAYGFCPAEYYIPRYKICNFNWTDKDREGFKNAGNTVEESFRLYEQDWDDEDVKDSPIIYENFALIAGCVWGDDSSWKVQHIDLTKVSEGIIIRSQPFGYIELPKKIDLKDAVTIDEGRIWIACTKYWDFSEQTGQIKTK